LLSSPLKNLIAVIRVHLQFTSNYSLEPNLACNRNTAQKDWPQSTAASEHINMYTLLVANSQYSKMTATAFLGSETDVSDSGGGKGMVGSK
jgi:hypothetical protein